MNQKTNEKIIKLENELDTTKEILKKSDLKQIKLTEKNFKSIRDEILPNIENQINKVKDSIKDVEKAVNKEIEQLSEIQGNDNKAKMKIIIDQLVQEYPTYKYELENNMLRISNPKNRVVFLSKIPKDLIIIIFPITKNTPKVEITNQKKYQEFVNKAIQIIYRVLGKVEIKNMIE